MSLSSSIRPRLVVFETRMLGDSVLSIPFLRAAASRYEVFFCCQPASVAIVNCVLDRKHILPWCPPWTAQSHRRWMDKEDRIFLRRLRDLKPDVAISVWADVRLHIWMALSGATRRVGYPMNAHNFYGSHLDWRRRQIWAGRWVAAAARVALLRPLLTDTVHRYSPRQHHMDAWRQLAEALDVGDAWQTVPPWFSVDNTLLAPEVRAFVDTTRQSGRPLWLLHPGGRNPVRRWRAANFAHVIDEVFLPQQVPLIIIHPPDADFPNIQGPAILNYAPTSLADLIPTVDAVDHVLCNDSVAAHLAAALGKRAVVIMGPMTPDWFAPYGDQHRVVHHEGGCGYHPCLDTCRMPSPVCMEAITVYDVVKTVKSVLAGE